ncbi:hypothetical protein [Desulfoluna sp.]|uniref:hypothetical protein n=1 Tax=Desulfoluna sp. TaxID=2045199 RepID=UPI002619904A|nr:hypothetical protein [Desulfoluna sp.]
MKRQTLIGVRPIVMKTLFAVLFLGLVLVVNGCGSDDAPSSSGGVVDSGDGGTDTGDKDDGDKDDGGGTSATGGMPSEWMTGVGVEKGSYPYLNRIGEKMEFSVYFKDRYGVYSDLVHKDNVHFRAEDGAATIESVTVENGIATAVLRSHDGGYLKGAGAWEATIPAEIPAYLWWSGDNPLGVPSRGRVSVLWYTRGEEWFTEKEGANHNDSYDSGELFVDTEDDPYLDENENGKWDPEEVWDDKNSNGIFDAGDTYTDTNGNGALDWGEYFKDANENNQRDSFNKTWDADKLIFGNVTFILTGDQPYIAWDKTNKTIANGGSGSVNVIVCDHNFNHLPAGASIAFSAKDSAGKEVTVYPKKITIPDNAGAYGKNAADQVEIITYAVTLTNSITEPEAPGDVMITVKASGDGLQETEATFSGVVTFD